MAALNTEIFCNVTSYSACQNLGTSRAGEGALQGAFLGRWSARSSSSPGCQQLKRDLEPFPLWKQPGTLLSPSENTSGTQRESKHSNLSQPANENNGRNVGFPSAPAQSTSTRNWISQRAAHPRFQQGHPVLGDAGLPKARAVPAPGHRAQHLPILLRKASSPPAPFPDFIPAVPMHHCRSNRSKVSLLN